MEADDWAPKPCEAAQFALTNATEPGKCLWLDMAYWQMALLAMPHEAHYRPRQKL